MGAIILRWRYTPQVGAGDVTSLAAIIGPRGLGIASQSFDAEAGVYTFTMTDGSTETVSFAAFVAALELLVGNAEDARDLARDWASKPQGQIVADGLYSALDRALAAAASASSAAGSASTATTALSDIQTIQTAINTVFDNFDDRFLGAFATADEPTTDNDGDPLVVGAIYWNTDEDELRFWNSTSWESPEATATLAAQQAAASAALAGTHKTDAQDARDAAQTAQTGAETALVYTRTEAVNAAQSATVATAAAAALVGTEGIIPTASEILWLTSKPQAGVNALGFFDTGARLLSGVSERALLRYGEDNDTLNFMLLDGGVDGVRLDFTADGGVYSIETEAAPGNSVAAVLDQSKVSQFVDVKSTGVVTTAGTPSAPATYNTATGEGAAVRDSVSAASGVLLAADVSAVHLIDVQVLSGGLTIRQSNLLGTILASASAPTRRTFLVSISAGDGFYFSASGDGVTTEFIIHSIREIPGTHSAQPSAALQPKYGKAPKVVRNLFVATEDFSNPIWTKQNVTIMEETIETPLGILVGAKIIEDDVNSAHVLDQRGNTALGGAGAYTYQYLARAGEVTEFQVQRTSSQTTSFAHVFDLAAGTVTGGGEIEVFHDDIYLCSGTFTHSEDFQGGSRIALRRGGETVYTGDGESGLFIFHPQVETGSTATPYQRVGASDLDVTESGVQSFGFIRPDLSDDVLPVTLPSAFDGDILIAGKKGTWIEPAAPSAGAFNLGPTTYTGGTPGILSAVGDLTGVELIDKTLSAEERARLIAYYKGRGAKGLLVPGPTPLLDDDFSGYADQAAAEAAGWVVEASWAFDAANDEFDKTPGTSAEIRRPVTIAPGSIYSLTVSVLNRTAGTLVVRQGSALIGSSFSTVVGVTGNGESTHLFVGNDNSYDGISLRADATFDGSATGITLQEYRPEEDW